MNRKTLQDVNYDTISEYLRDRIKNNTPTDDKEYNEFVSVFLKNLKKVNKNKDYIRNLKKLKKKENDLIEMIGYIFDSKKSLKVTKKNFFLANILRWENFYKNSTFFNKPVNKIIDVILNDNKKKINILEFGSGTGSLALKLSKKLFYKRINFNFLITDYKLVFLKRIEKFLPKNKKIQFKTVDINNFQNIFYSKFDFIIMNNVFHLIKNDEKFSQQIKKIMKKNTKVLIHENHRVADKKVILFELIYMLFDEYRDLIKSKKNFTYGIDTEKNIQKKISRCFPRLTSAQKKISNISSIFCIN